MYMYSVSAESFASSSIYVNSMCIMELVQLLIRIEKARSVSVSRVTWTLLLVTLVSVVEMQ